MKSNNFKEKVAFVTGAASSIGRATATAFAAEGASVVADISEHGSQETTNIITEDLFERIEKESKDTCLYTKLRCKNINDFVCIMMGPYVYVKFDSQHSGPVSKVEKEALFDL